MRTLRYAATAGAFALLASAGISRAQPHELRFPTGPPELIEPADPAKAGRVRLLTRSEYDDLTANLHSASYVPIHKAPDSLSPGAGFGIDLVLAGKNCGFAVDGSVEKGYVLYADLDADGDLSDEAPIPLERRDRYYTVLLKRAETETRDGETVIYPVEVRFLFVRVPTPSGWQMAYRVVDETVRRGTIAIDGRETAFALIGHPGLYDKPGCWLWVDSNGDGKGMEDEDSIERYQPGNRYVKIGGQGYEFRIDPFGRSLSLTPTDRHVADRATLEPGAAAPDFSVTDIEGKVHRLADYRGKVLLIDVWELWCHPCRDEAPDLAALDKRYRKRGLTIVGLSSATPKSIRDFAREYAQDWPQVSDPVDGPIHALFRVRSYPTHILIDREGRMVTRDVGGLELGKFQPVLEKTLTQP